jgi:CRISPR-associated protein Cmr3
MSRQVRTLGRDDDPAREALWWPAPPGDGKPAPAPRWWRHEDLVGWLAGERATVNRADCPSLWRRLQAHVSIRAESQTAEDGLLFQHDVVETIERDHEWAICVEAEFPDGAIPTIASIGGGRRLARVEPLESNVFEPPERVLSAFRAGSRGLRLVGVTPALFGAGWLPDGLGASNGAYRGRLPVLAYDLVLRSALVQRPANVVGWDMASNTSRATARMVPAGSVYFFERADGGPFDDADAGVLWLTALGGRTEEGFGRFVPGVWNPERSAA